MNFAHPLAFIGLLAVPAIIAMYLFKQKYNETPISSLYLWESIDDEPQASSSWQKLRVNLLMILQIIAAILLVLALSGPYIAGASQAKSYILVLDASLSMQTEHREGSRFDTAKAEAVKLVESMESGAYASVMMLNGNPHIVVTATNDKKLLKTELEALEPSAAAANWDTAATLLEALYQDGETEIYLFSDSIYQLSVPMNMYIVGETADNIAVTSLTFTVEADRIVAMAKVKSYAAIETTASIAIYADDVIVDVQDIVLAAGGEQDVFFTNVPLNAKQLMAKITDSDSLVADNYAYAVVNQSTAKKTLLLTEGNVFLENILKILSNVELYKGDPDNIESLTGYYLYIFDGVLPENLPTDGHILVFNPPKGNNLIETGGERSVDTIAISGHSLLNYITTLDMSISKAKVITRPAWAQTVAADGDYPLIVAGVNGSQRIAVCAFDLHNTDLPLRSEFPIFIYNLCNWFMPDNAITNGTISGSTAEIILSPQSVSAQVLLPNGNSLTLAPPFPASSLTDTNSAGIYTLEEVRLSGDTEIKSYTYFAVNANTSESDLTMDTAEGFYTADGEVAGRAANLNFSPYLMIMLIIVLMIEWWVYSREA